MYNGMHVQRAIEFNRKLNETLSLLATGSSGFLSEELEQTAISSLANLVIKTAEEIKEKMESKPSSSQVNS